MRYFFKMSCSVFLFLLPLCSYAGDPYEHNQNQNNQQAQINRLNRQVDYLMRQAKQDPNHCRKSVAGDFIGYAQPGNKDLHLGIYGWVQNAMKVVDDGINKKFFIGSAPVFGNRINFVFTKYINPDLMSIGFLQVGYEPSSLALVTQGGTVEGTGEIIPTSRYRQLPPAAIRNADIVLTSRCFGQLAFGRGWTAMYFSTIDDKSGTIFLNYSVSNLWDFRYFFRRKNSSFLLPDTELRNVMGSLFYGFRRDRVWYKSPEWNGFYLWGDVCFGNKRQNDGDLLIGYKRENDCYKLSGTLGAAYPLSPNAGFCGERNFNELEGWLYNATFSILWHNGLNFCARVSYLDNDNRLVDNGNVFAQNIGKKRKPQFYFAKFGYRTKDLWSLGESRFSFTASQSNHFSIIGDRVTAYNLSYQQEAPCYNLSFGIGFGNYSLNRSHESFHPINSGNLFMIYYFGRKHGYSPLPNYEDFTNFCNPCHTDCTQ